MFHQIADTVGQKRSTARESAIVGRSKLVNFFLKAGSVDRKDIKKKSIVRGFRDETGAVVLLLSEDISRQVNLSESKIPTI